MSKFDFEVTFANDGTVSERNIFTKWMIFVNTSGYINFLYIILDPVSYCYINTRTHHSRHIVSYYQ
jgi:hypothetical protein